MHTDEMYDIFMLIGLEPSRTAKVHMLDHPMEQVLHYAYNPHLQYGIKIVPDNWIGQGSAGINKLGYRLLDSLASRTLTGTQAKEMARRYMRFLTPKSAKLFRLILKKDLRIGIGPQMINTKFTGLIPQFKIMKAEEYRENKIHFPCFVSVKIDGVRGYYKHNEMSTREGHFVHGVKHIIKDLWTQPYHVDGEFHIMGRSREYISGQVRNHKACPDVMFHAFDLPNLEMPFAERYEVLENVVRNMTHVIIIPHTLIYTMGALEDYYKASIAMGYEGVVIKSHGHAYQSGYSFDWMKRVKNKSIDLEVMYVYGGEEGKQFENSLGGVIVMYQGVEIKVGSGFTVPERTAFYENPDLIVGKKIQIFYQYITDKGSMYHPRYGGIRHG